MRSSARRLQTTRRPDLVLDHLLRIGRRAFVSFPNFAHWRGRTSLMWGGRMPVTRLLPEQWYDTPNIHHVTIDDFRAFVKGRGITVEGAWFLSGDKRTTSAAANFFAEHAVFLMTKLISIRNSSAPSRVGGRNFRGIHVDYRPYCRRRDFRGARSRAYPDRCRLSCEGDRGGSYSARSRPLTIAISPWST